MLARDGSLLCHCDSRKAQWYLAKGLADRVSDNPLTIQLRFEHKTGDQEQGTNDFYTESKENRCVGCGRPDGFSRYRIIPSCYRRHFPVALKSHRSHDVVLLCLSCQASRGREGAAGRVGTPWHETPCLPPGDCPAGGGAAQAAGGRGDVHPPAGPRDPG